MNTSSFITMKDLRVKLKELGLPSAKPTLLRYDAQGLLSYTREPRFGYKVRVFTPEDVEKTIKNIRAWVERDEHQERFEK